jgi:hypothetical protein
VLGIVGEGAWAGSRPAHGEGGGSPDQRIGFREVSGHPAGVAGQHAGRRCGSRPTSAKEAGAESAVAEERGVSQVSASGGEEGVAQELASGEEFRSW